MVLADVKATQQKCAYVQSALDYIHSPTCTVKLSCAQTGCVMPVITFPTVRGRLLETPITSISCAEIPGTGIMWSALHFRMFPFCIAYDLLGGPLKKCK